MTNEQWDIILKEQKEFQKFYDAYTLNIPYNGKILTDYDFKKFTEYAEKHALERQMSKNDV